MGGYMRHGRLAGLMLAGAIIMMLLAGWAPRSAGAAETVTYFAQMGSQWGLPVGIRPLSDAEFRHRERSYRFTHAGDRLVAVDLVNSHGRRAEFLDRHYGPRFSPSNAFKAAKTTPAGWRLAYGASGALDTVTLLDFDGEVIRREQYDLSADRKQAVVSLLTERGHAWFKPGKDGFSNISRLRLHFDDAGRTIETWHESAAGKRAVDADGIAGWRYDHDGQGRLVSETTLDWQGEVFAPGAFEDMTVQTRHDYADGWRVRITWLNRDGVPAVNKESACAMEQQDRDRWGNLTARRCLDRDGRPIAYKRQGAVRVIRRAFDDRGNLVERAHFRRDDEPMDNAQGFAKVRYGYDDRGNRTEIAYFDTAGQAKIPGDSWINHARKTMVFDDGNRLVQETLFGADGKPLRDTRRFARRVLIHDDNGFLAAEAVFDAEGRPGRNHDRFFSRHMENDDQGRPVRMIFFGPGKDPVSFVEQKDGFGRDDKGLAIQVESSYDDRGLLVERRYLNGNGAPAPQADGVASRRLTHDDQGRLVDIAFFGTFGSPASEWLDYGAHRVVFEHDSRGNVIRERYFGGNGKPVRYRDGAGGANYFGRRWTYNDQGNWIEMAYLDRDGTLTPEMRTKSKLPIVGWMVGGDKGGHAREVRKYDQWARRIGESTHDARGNLTMRGRSRFLGRTNAAKQGVRWDLEKGLLTRTYYGPDGRPREDKSGFAASVSQWDALGRIVGMWRLDAEGRVTAGISDHAYSRNTLDSRGNQIETAYFDADGRPVARKDGIARRTFVYDAMDRIIAENRYDAAGNLVADHQGVARIVREFDESTGSITERFFGADGLPAANSKKGGRTVLNNWTIKPLPSNTTATKK